MLFSLMFDRKGKFGKIDVQALLTQPDWGSLTANRTVRKELANYFIQLILAYPSADRETAHGFGPGCSAVHGLIANEQVNIRLIVPSHLTAIPFYRSVLSMALCNAEMTNAVYVSCAFK